MNGATATGSLVGFGRELRSRGLPVGTGRVVTFFEAMGALAPVDPEKLYWAARLSLVARHDDLAIFEEVFRSYFARPHDSDDIEDAAHPKTPDRDPKTEPGDSDKDEGGLNSARPPDDAAGRAREEVPVMASSVERLKLRSFEHMSPEERAAATNIIRSLAVTLPQRRTRRWRAEKRGVRLDLRRTLRGSIRTDGEMLRRARRARRIKRRSLVLLLDVSGSMSAYSRALLHFGYAAMAAGQRVEVFCFGTRLTRVTDALRAKDPDRALADITATVHDWDGGTMIGSSVAKLLDRYRSSPALRGGVVVICSDGLERGDPLLLAAQMARLRRIAHKVVWVNPLKGGREYEPLARGMAAALPHLDEFLEGHDLNSLEALGRVLER